MNKQDQKFINDMLNLLIVIYLIMLNNMVIKINIDWCVSTNGCFISAAELTNRDIVYEKVLNLNFSD